MRLQRQGLLVNADGDPDLVGAVAFYPDNGSFTFKLHCLRAVEIDSHLDYRVNPEAAVSLKVNAGKTNVACRGFNIGAKNLDRQDLMFAVCFARSYREGARAP